MLRRGWLLKGVLAGTLARTAAECRELARAVVSREREACMVQQLISMRAVCASVRRDSMCARHGCDKLRLGVLEVWEGEETFHGEAPQR
jgi:hypothetical protein